MGRRTRGGKLTGEPDAERVNGERVAELVRAAARAYDYVVVDVPTHRPDLAGPALAACDAAHLVVSPSPVSVSRALQVKARLAGEVPGLRLVLDQERAGAGLERGVVEAQLGAPCVGAIEHSDRPALDALTEGVPLVKRSPRSGASVQLTSLARRALCLTTDAAQSPWMSLLDLFR